VDSLRYAVLDRYKIKACVRKNFLVKAIETNGQGTVVKQLSKIKQETVDM
jgi:hypothetical protein